MIVAIIIVLIVIIFILKASSGSQNTKTDTKPSCNNLATQVQRDTTVVSPKFINKRYSDVQQCSANIQSKQSVANISQCKTSSIDTSPMHSSQYISNVSASEIPNSRCLLCSQSVTAANAILLTNGNVIHKNCYDKIKDIKSSTYKDIIAKVHAFWPGYPPDWNQRKAGVLREAGYKCSVCGAENVTLQAHHVIPIGQPGSSNEFKNLVCVCESCHRKLHGGRSLSVDFDKTPTTIKNIVKQALEQKKQLYIVYSDIHGKITSRIIMPRSITHRDYNDYLEAYCTLRHAIREFRLAYIKEAKIVD